jgi:Ca2+-dependent lipid-binding protein
MFLRRILFSDTVVVGKSDPFAVFSLNDQKVFKSTTVKKTLNPVWNENFVTSIVSHYEICTKYSH